MKRVFSKDAPYQRTSVRFDDTLKDITDLLHKYGAADIRWNDQRDRGSVEVGFRVTVREAGGRRYQPPVWISVPLIWKKTADGSEVINWDQSGRVLYWYLKSQLEMTLMGRSFGEVFLAFVRNHLPSDLVKQLEETAHRRLSDTNILALNRE
jgi:hypothetical protein